MNVEQILIQRSNKSCELCSSPTELSAYAVPPKDDSNAEHCVLLCKTCLEQIENPACELDVHHWRCLNDSMWSQLPAVQVMAWRQLKRLSSESWAEDLLNMMYMDDETLAWAKAGKSNQSATDINSQPTVDSNGTSLEAGDSVTLIKDLVVKGAGFTAKRGTAVRGISLTDNPEQIEGRVNGVRIVLLTKYLKKSN
jgi:protein PhnA